MTSFTRRSIIKKAGVSAGVAGIIGTAAGKDSNKVHLGEVSISYEISEKISPGWRSQSIELDEPRPYTVMNDVIQLEDTNEKSDLKQVLESNSAVINFGGVRPVGKGNFGDVQSLYLLKDEYPRSGATRIWATPRGRTHEVPKFNIQPTNQQFIVEVENNVLDVSNNESRKIPLREHKKELSVISVKSEYSLVDEGVIPARKTKFRTETVQMQPKLTIRNFGNLTISD